MNQPAALYARVSSDRQKENHTIASQVAALTQYAETNGYLVPPEWQFQDDGYSGATLVRPGLEALRDLAAEGQIQAVLIYSPDRSAKQPSLWRKSSSRKIRGFLPDVPSNHPCCRGCWSVSVVVMDSTELRRELPSARSTTIAA